MEIFRLVGAIFIDNEAANRKIGETDNKAKGVAGTLGGMLGTAAKWGAAIVTGATVAAGAMFALTNRITEQADAIAKGALKLGVTTDAYQELDYWASQNGISHATMERAVGRLNQRIGAALEGSSKYVKGFASLGVALEDTEGRVRSTESVLNDTIEALRKIEDSQTRATKAAEIFGTQTARQLLPALEDSSLSIEEAAERAHMLGIVLDKEGLEAAERYQDSLDDMRRSMGAVMQQIGLRLIPIFQSFLDWVLDNMPTIQAVIGVVFDVISGLVRWWGQVIENVLFPALVRLWEWIEPHVPLIRAIFEAAIAVIVGALAGLGDWLKRIWEGSEEFRAGVAVVMGDLAEFIQGIIARIMEFWDEHGQMIMDAVRNVWNFISGIIERVMPYILNIIRTVWNAIAGVISGVVDIIMGIIRFFSALFTGEWDEMWEAVKQILGGAVEIVVSLFSGIVDIVKNVLGAIWSLIKDLPGKVWNWLLEVIAKVINWGLEMREKAIQAVNDLVTSIVDGIKGLPGQFLQLGKDMINGLIDGVKSLANSAVEAVKDVGRGIADGFKSIFGIKSPSVVFAKFGTNLGEGLAIGMDASRHLVDEAANRMAAATVPDMPGQTLSAASSGGAPVYRFEANSVQITIPVNQIKDIQDLIDMFSRLPQFARARG